MEDKDPFIPHDQDLGSCRAVKLPWIFLGAPLTFNGAPRNIQGNLDRYATDVSIDLISMISYSINRSQWVYEFSPFFPALHFHVHRHPHRTIPTGSRNLHGRRPRRKKSYDRNVICGLRTNNITTDHIWHKVGVVVILYYFVTMVTTVWFHYGQSIMFSVDMIDTWYVWYIRVRCWGVML